MIAFLREPLAINSLAKSGNVTRSPSEKQVDILNQLKTNSTTVSLLLLLEVMRTKTHH